LQRNPNLAPYELLFRAVLVAGGLAAAEATSRLIAPKKPWSELLKMGSQGDQFTHSKTPVASRSAQSVPLYTTAPLMPRKAVAEPLHSPLTFSRTFAEASVFRGTFQV
jgi:hypothetical protein